MLEKYQSIIYQNEEDKEKVKKDCLNFIIHKYKNYTKEEILNLIFSDQPNEISDDYAFALLETEGHMLFDITAKKFGFKIWKGKAWKNKTCKRKCPFGDECKKYLITIDNLRYCYGQLYYNKITENEIIEMSKNHKIKIINPNENVHIDLNMDYDEQIFSNFFFDYEWFICWFGDNAGRKNKKVNGYNVIHLL